ncbi:hypothetical protein PCASD_23306 [Puccinia coronata f. sp. avenae]|uniref:Tet-like 2OG-Fe(II) oxygenase domain-containing protein n=1 Tax=Puccinia coronata f. sp. avenae TaxID=200324 RepID=A0A2N5TSR2_9BASI|nr:hypothetical protein PCASD_23306 [Puccinia coronata f. sp. avenae]
MQVALVKWTDLRVFDLNLYPTIPLENKKPTQKPTSQEVEAAYAESRRLGKIIGTQYKQTAESVFNNNQELMKKHNLPLFDSLAYDDKATDLTCAPQITFTTNGFFNPPHTNDEDISKYAFAMFLPTLLSDGSLITEPSTYNISSGPFVFPDRKIGIDFDQQFGVI